MQSDFKRVSHQNKCPVCDHSDWCGVSADGVWAVCMRVESGKQTRNGGWLHRLKDSPPPPTRFRLRPEPAKPSLVNMGAYHSALRRKWTNADLDVWAADLGVHMDALDRLQPAFDPANDALAFPMRDGSGAVTGIRLRAKDGKKWAVRGGGDGLFYDPGLVVEDSLVVCEGPTDTAAAYSLGLDAVGRPSCLGGVAELAALVRRMRVRSLTIVADHDEPHERADGAQYAPGLDGARKLISELKKMARIVVPPAKDMRAWFRAGATREQFDVLALSATWRVG